MPEPAARRLGAALLATSLSLPVFLLATAAAPVPARAESARVVGRLQGSGLVFKDTLQIESFDDPKVQGVTLYVSNFERPITERLTSNFLQDPSYASVVRAKYLRLFLPGLAVSRSRARGEALPLEGVSSDELAFV
jgi:hypothetical protein